MKPLVAVVGRCAGSAMGTDTQNHKYSPPSGALILYHTNIRSLPHKHHLLQTHISALDHPPDIIAISDNYLKSDVDQNSFPLIGYEQKHKKDITVYYNPNLHITIPDINIPEVATFIIQIHKTKHLDHPIHTIFNLYRRPRKAPNLLQDLQTEIINIRTKTPTTSIEIQGDLNHNILSLTPDHAITKFMLAL